MKYSELVSVYKRLDNTTKRLEKTHIISEFLKDIKDKDTKKIVLLIQGKIFPDWDDRKIGVASRLVLKAINKATGTASEKVEKEWKNTGDLGIAAENLIKKKKQATLFSAELTVTKVFDNVQKLATLEGAGSVDHKISLIAELLTSAKPEEGKYIVRTVLEDMRVGVGEGSMRDAIVWAYFGKEAGVKYVDGSTEIEDRAEYNKYVDAVQRAYDLTNDLGAVTEAAKDGLKKLERLELSIGNPIKVMLALRVKDVKEGFERVGVPAQLEYKYDGFRIQIHKNKDEIRLYTRRLEEVTSQFPDVVEFVKKHTKGDSFILDSECVGYDPKTGKYLAFQKISQRIKRKYDIEDMAKKFPVEVNVFDVISYNGKNMIAEPMSERRKIIERIVKKVEKKILPSKHIITSDEKDAEKFYRESLKAGNEGIMLKSLESPYKPGARVGFMVKLKPVMDTLDLVIVGAEWGEGKRSHWLSSFTLACVSDGKYLEIGKMGTGIKEKAEEGVSFEQLTEELKPLIISEKGKEVTIKPKIVVEVKFEEIQKSPTYSSGYALRFPRLEGLREDRHAKDASTLEMVEDYYEGQRGR
ncbi:MAG: ATP-dependent DNA ligase [Nanoarchaeota archaeon]|nr:ATP-dependent DNA ligase [Nanoarchaeota archaeon]MBU1704918.1 ATP-dependent DNA ligase [Nanoarchaeota archaeon]